MDEIILTPLKIIEHPKGNILHAIKINDIGYVDFGECYFSSVNQNEIKGWKKHNLMTLNLVVPVGEIEIVVFNQIKNSFFSIKLSKDNYKRITIPPGLWVAFKGIDKTNMLLNIASITHDPTESINTDLKNIEYLW